MIEGPVGGAPALLAVCEGTSVGDQIFGVIAALLIAVVWLWITWLIVGRDREPGEWKALGAIYVISAIVAAVVLPSVHVGLAGVIAVSVGLTAAIGAGGALLSSQIGVGRGIAAAVAGDLLIPVAIVVLLIVEGAVGSGCLGEELGLLYGLRWSPA